MRAIAVTTIADQDSLGVKRLIKWSEICSAQLVLMGDKKSPVWNKNRLPRNVHYFSIEEQNFRWPRLSQLIPLNHYGRKNLAYLWAVENGIEILLDTDDDNFSESDVFAPSTKPHRKLPEAKEWVNVYAYFGQNKLWPRGLPLDEAMFPIQKTIDCVEETEWHCFQAVVDGDPDLDAIGRMLYPESHIFENQAPLLLENGTFCPTNSQATLWKRELFPYLYLPVTAPFRMTDIWRGIVLGGYMCLKGYKTFFGKLGVTQSRNVHNLIYDFQDEIQGHINNKVVRSIADMSWFEKRNLEAPSILRNIYRQLCNLNIVESNELLILDNFLKQISQES